MKKKIHHRDAEDMEMEAEERLAIMVLLLIGVYGFGFMMGMLYQNLRKQKEYADQ